MTRWRYVLKFTVFKYALKNGKIPFDQCFYKLDHNFQARVDIRIDRLSLGNFGDYKKISKDIYELRLFFGQGYRVYFGIEKTNLILLLCADNKNSQHKDVKLASNLWKKYKQEERENAG